MEKTDPKQEERNEHKMVEVKEKVISNGGIQRKGDWGREEDKRLRCSHNNGFI